MSASKVLPITSKYPVAHIAALSHHSRHIVQFYREDQSLVSALGEYIGTGLTDGGAAIVIAAAAHRAALAHELEGRGFDIAKLADQGRYLSLDASETLAQFMLDGMPDAAKFEALMDNVVSQARPRAKSDRPCIVAFGEMVALLWSEGKHDAAIRLEQLWNDFAKTHSLALRCAYPMTGFSEHTHGEAFMKICAEHSEVIPEGPSRGPAGDDGNSRRIAELQQKIEAFEKQKSLRQTEQQFRLLVEAVQDYAIFMLDFEGHIRTWNAGAQRIKGYKAAEIIGKHFSCFYPEEDVASGKPKRELEIAAREGRLEDEGWRVRKDGSKFWANVIITALRDPEGNLIGFGKVTRDATDRMLAQRALEESQQKLQESEKSLRQLSFHLLRTQDEERRRIGRDLHDSLGQILAVLKIKLDSLLSRVNSQMSTDVQDLKQCVQMSDQAVKEIRTISYLLYPPMLEEMGLKSAIPWYLEGFTKRSGIKTTFEVSPGLKRLPSDNELALFRVLQESLTNVHRHSGSPTATIRVSIDEKAVVLQVIDNGRGVNTQNLERTNPDWVGALGVGLRGMHERMRQVGGSLEVLSTPHGTTVTATVPITESPEPQTQSC